MKKFGGLALMALLLVAAPAFAQDQAQSADNNNGSQAEMSTVGTITEIDLADGTLTLDNGMQFKLAPSFQFTSAPRLGDQVEVIYDQEGSQNVAHSVDSGFYGQSHSS